MNTDICCAGIVGMQFQEYSRRHDIITCEYGVYLVLVALYKLYCRFICIRVYLLYTSDGHNKNIYRIIYLMESIFYV